MSSLHVAAVPSTKPESVEAPTTHMSENRMRNAFQRSIGCGGFDFQRGIRGSYKNDRLEARYQGFKLALTSVVTETVSLIDLTSPKHGKYD
jgi:hypothetical protein